MSDSMEKVLMIFVKNPEKGRVKTRLAESVGNAKALEIYRHLLKVTKSIAGGFPYDRQVWYSNFIEDDDIWEQEKFYKRLQSGEDLGDRMKTAFQRAFAEGYDRVVIIGSDCAALTEAIIGKAFKMLEETELVIGPSKDGGYYLLGMSNFYPGLFDDKAWSTSEVLKQTLDQAKSMDLSFELLPELNDIDTIEDLEASDIEITL